MGGESAGLPRFLPGKSGVEYGARDGVTRTPPGQSKYEVDIQYFLVGEGMTKSCK